MRVVLDTNVWVSGLLLPRSKAGLILKSWQQEKISVVVSQPILKEIERVLLYLKIAKRLGWDTTKTRNYTSLLRFFNEYVEIKDNLVEVLKDPDDSPILTTLIVSKADWLITGDADLLELKDKYSVISISEFYDTLGI